MSHRARALNGPVTDRALPEGTMGDRFRGYGRDICPWEVALQQSLRELTRENPRIPKNAEALRRLADTLLCENLHLIQRVKITTELVRNLLQKSFEEEIR